jgi:multiple sugar transport system ATP-binding protein
MRTELKRFHQDLHATIIYVTHDQLEAVTMADKMAVMNGGSMQQYDSPKAVFDHPVNTFVASFVGSPAMSLVPLRRVVEGDGVSLAGDGWTLPLSPRNARKARAARGDALILGARHSTITLHHGPVPDGVPDGVPGRVYTVEPTGDVTFAQVRVDGSIVIVSLPPDVPVQADTQVWLGFDQNRMHLFDGETQMALTAG